MTQNSVSRQLHRIYCRDGTGQDFLDPTGKFQNHRRLTGFFTENFCSLFNVSYQNFSKGCMGEVLKFVTLQGGLRKKCKKNLKMT